MVEMGWYNRKNIGANWQRNHNQYYQEKPDYSNQQIVGDFGIGRNT